jgi:hypothetical protein
MASVLQESPVEPRTDNATAVAAVELTIESSEALRAELLRGEVASRRILGQLRAGVPLVESVSASGRSAADVRDSVQRQLDSYLESRRRARLLLIDACLRAGLTRGRIARMLGVTRQRVAVLAKDLPGGDTCVAEPSPGV